jgi:hypothetical protein
MGLFGRKKLDVDHIARVVILEKTQNYKRQSNAGLIFGNDVWNPDVVMMDGGVAPAGVTYTFSVTYKNGQQEIFKVDSGTPVCELLLQKAMDGNETEQKSTDTDNKKGSRAPELRKNQLPNGIFVIGRDVPPGAYDFHLVWGHGSISLYKDKETILGNLKFTEYLGFQYDYEKVDCIHVVCENGDYLHLDGNLIVDIAKSKEIELDL